MKLSDIVLATAYRVITKLIDHTGPAIDDEDVAPLVAQAASAVAELLESMGASKEEATVGRKRVLAYATEVYCALCAKQDPEGADFADDSARFRRLLTR